jgi:hypothetical protein
MSRPVEIRGTISSVTTSGVYIPIQVDKSSGSKRMIQLDRVMVKHTGGSGTSFVVSAGVSDSFSTATIEEKYLSGSTAVAALLDDTSIASTFETASAGTIWLKITPNSASNNAFSYAVVVFLY